MDDDFDDNLLLEAAMGADEYLNVSQPKPEHLECLRTKFGHNEFRPRQWDIVRSIIEDKRDNCVIMPTGYGKSLLFQYPAVFTNGITLVVSPLISLMQDQVRSLSVANIPACFLGSAQTDRSTDARALAGEFRLVYASPEYITNATNWLKSLEKMLTLVAIDEAHCVSQWGHDFRSDYRRLDVIRRTIPSVPILSVTATATAHVQDDISRSLNLRNPQFINMGFDRPNIHFTFKPKSKDIWTDLKPFTTLLKGSTIIYVLKKSVSEEIARILRNNGVSCDIYHAGLSLAKRKTVLNDFTRDVLNVIVATVAFGMGIDKPDVRTIVHYGASKNMESYYQEVGRAGRDGGPSHAITYFDRSDFNLHDWFLNENHEKKSESVIEHLRAIGQKMREFCYTARCRRKCLLDYFDSNTTAMRPRKGCCDNCDRGSSSIQLSAQYENIDDNGYYDFTQNAHLLLQAIQITGKTTVAVAVLRGSAEQKAIKFKNQREVYGAGKVWPKDFWTTLIQQLKCDGYLTMKSLPAPYRPIVVISQKGFAWLDENSKDRLLLKAIPEIYKFFAKKRQTSTTVNNNLPIRVVVPDKPKPVGEEQAVEEADEDISDYLLSSQMTDKHLEEILLAVRKELAKLNDHMPALVASELAIEQIAAKKPLSMTEFKANLFDGFSLAKTEKFAAAFINATVKFVNQDFCMSKLLSTYPLKKYPSQLTQQDQLRLLKLIEKQHSLEDFEPSFNLTNIQLINEIANFMRLGFSITKLHLFHLVRLDAAGFAYIQDQTTRDDLYSIDDLDAIRDKYAGYKAITDQKLLLALQYIKVRNFLKSIIKVPYYDVDAKEFHNVEVLMVDRDIASTPPSTIISAVDRLLTLPTALTLASTASSSKNNMTASSSETQIGASNVTETISKFEAPKKVVLDNKNPSQASAWNRLLNVPESRAGPTKMVATGWIGTKPSKRLVVKATSRVQYLSDSDSDENSRPEAKRKSSQTERTIPQWISTSSARQPKAGSRGNLSQPRR